MALRQSLCLSALLLVVGSPLCAQEKPNIVYIMADDLGYGDLGCYGQEKIRTPHIDRLAAEGVRFTDYYAGSTVCAPSRCVLMTGRHLGHCFIRGNGKVDLRREDVTVAEVLKQAGYVCGQFGKWGLGHENSSGVPTLQGFDEFFGYLDQHHAHNYYPSFLVHNRRRVRLRNVVPDEGEYGQGVASRKVEYSHDLIMERALQWLDRSANRTFFLYLSVTLPHANNEARQEGMEIPDYGPYADADWPEPQKGTAAMISRLDADVGRVMERLKSHGIDERTIVLFTSDNGPHAEGGNNPGFFDSNGPLRGIKRDLYEGGIRVPMIVRWPGRTRPGTTSAHVAYHGDLLATAAELAGARPPRELDSLSMLPAILGNERQQPRHEFLYWEFYEQGGRRGARQGDWKAVQNGWDPASPGSDGRIELYNLAADIGERRDLAGERPEIVARMRRIMDDAHVPDSKWEVRGRRNR